MNACKQPAFLSMAEQCCKSCPLQATPIVLPPTFAPSDLTVGLSMDSYSATMGEDLEVCCVASSVTNPTMEAFLDLVIPCDFSADSKKRNYSRQGIIIFLWGYTVSVGGG